MFVYIYLFVDYKTSRRLIGGFTFVSTKYLVAIKHSNISLSDCNRTLSI